MWTAQVHSSRRALTTFCRTRFAYCVYFVSPSYQRGNGAPKNKTKRGRNKTARGEDWRRVPGPSGVRCRWNKSPLPPGARRSSLPFAYAGHGSLIRPLTAGLVAPAHIFASLASFLACVSRFSSVELERGSRNTGRRLSTWITWVPKRGDVVFHPALIVECMGCLRLYPPLSQGRVWISSGVCFSVGKCAKRDCVCCLSSLL